MKIAQIGCRTTGYYGGVETYIRETAPLLSEKGHEISAYVIKGYNHKKILNIDLTEESSINVCRLEKLIYGFRASLDASLKDVDVVHYHIPISGAWAIFPKLAGKSVVLTVHGNGRNSRNWDKLTKLIHKGIERIAVGMADKITTVTPTLKTILEEEYGREVEYIPHGAKKSPYKPPELIKSFGLSERDYILYLGRLTHEKGADVLIKAYKQIKNPDKKLVIAGSSSYTDDFVGMLHSIAGNDHNIIFTGLVEKELIEELYSNTYFFVSPMKIRGLPLTLLEAMSYGKCVVSSDVDKTKEAYNHTIHFINNDHLDLSNQLKKLFENPEILQKFAEQSRQYVEANHSWENVAKSFEAIYQKIKFEEMALKRKLNLSKIIHQSNASEL